MSELVAIIDDYRDRHGQPSEASVARAIGVSPATVNAWRNRGIRELPALKTLRALAELTGRSYSTVILPAVLRDVGYLEKESDGHGRDDNSGAAPTNLREAN